MKIFLIGIALFGMSVYSSVEAADAPPPLSNILPKDIISARALVSPTGLRTRIPITEANLSDYSCNTAIKKIMSDMPELVSIINQHVTVIKEERPSRILLANAIYLTLQDGTKLKFLMDDGGNGLFNGRYQVGDLPETTIRADGTFVASIANWMLKAGNVDSINRSELCNRIASSR